MPWVRFFAWGFPCAQQQKLSPAVAQNMLMVTNWGDPAVNLAATDDLVNAWRKQGNAVATYRFPCCPGCRTILSPPTPLGPTPAVTYPELLKLLTGNPE